MLDNLKLDLAGLAAEGIPAMHAKAFTFVAKNDDPEVNNSRVIMTRTPGEACEMLLRQGYDAKGFFIKAKSCDWGPMSGFLCLDPRMNKSKDNGAYSNLKETLHSLKDAYEDGESAKAVHIHINKERLDWLIKKGLKVEAYKATEHYTCKVDQLEVLLLKTIVNNVPVWAMYYDIKKFYGAQNASSLELVNRFKSLVSLSDDYKKSEAKDKKDTDDKISYFWNHVAEKLYLKSMDKNAPGAEFEHYVALMGLGNPHPTYNLAPYLNAVTGDYDLYAIWPKTIDANLDSRLAGMSAGITDQNIVDGENQSKFGKLYGNISQRIFDVAQEINSYMSHLSGAEQYPNRVYHSDECGRPFLGAIDGAVAFMPNGDFFMVKNGKDLAEFIRYCSGQGFKCFVNIAWLKQLKEADTDIEKFIHWAPEPPAAKKA